MSAFKFIIRLDDIAPNMHVGNFRRAAQLFEQFGVKPLIGVIPQNRDSELLTHDKWPGDFWGEMRALVARGWECALHGFQHLNLGSGSSILRRNSQSEFAGLSYETQMERLSQAKSILEEQQLPASVFMAPWHSFDRTTLRVLKELGFRALTDGYALFPYYFEGMLFVPQLFARPRRYPLGLHTFCLHLNHFDAADFACLANFLDRNHRDAICFSAAKEFVLSNALQWPNRLLGSSIEQLRAWYRCARQG